MLQKPFLPKPAIGQHPLDTQRVGQLTARLFVKPDALVGRVSIATPIPQVDHIPAAQGRLERMMTGPARFPGIVAFARPLLAAVTLADGAVQNQHILGDPFGLDQLLRQAHRRRAQRLAVPLPEFAQEARQHTGRLRQPGHPKTRLQGLQEPGGERGPPAGFVRTPVADPAKPIGAVFRALGT